MPISTSGVSYTEWKKTNPDGTYAEWRVAPPATTTTTTTEASPTETSTPASSGTTPPASGNEATRWKLNLGGYSQEVWLYPDSYFMDDGSGGVRVISPSHPEVTTGVSRRFKDSFLQRASSDSTYSQKVNDYRSGVTPTPPTSPTPTPSGTTVQTPTVDDSTEDPDTGLPTSRPDSPDDGARYLDEDGRVREWTGNYWRVIGTKDDIDPTTGDIKETTGEVGFQEEVDIKTQSVENALSVLEGSPFFQGLPPDMQALLRMTVKSWSPDKEINMENVLSEFNKIKTETIDPQFAENIQVFSDDVRTNLANLAQARGGELEAERFGAGENIRQAREGLEKSGMTFTGKGIEQLGAQSAFAQPGATGDAYMGYIDGQLQTFPTKELAEQAGATGIKENTQSTVYGRAGFSGVVDGELRTFSSKEMAEANGATNITQLGAQQTGTVPTQTPFGGLFHEGTVNQANRLMSTASNQRYQENIRALGRQAENVLGGSEAMNLVPGFSQSGVTTGSLQANQQQQYADALSSLAGQQRQLNTYKQPVDFSNFNQTFNQ